MTEHSPEKWIVWAEYADCTVKLCRYEEAILSYKKAMGMYHDCPDLDAFDLSQIFIDERYQGKGYGKAATKLVLDAMKQDGMYSKAVLCFIEGNDAAKNLYESFGFVEIDRDEDEIIME